jgi:hypothetical protein
MDSTRTKSDGRYPNQEPDGCPPPYSPQSRAGKPDQEEDGEAEIDVDQDEEGLERSDEDSVDGEFEDKVREELERFRKPYNPQQEAPPSNYAAYHPSFAKVETLCGEVFEEAITLLQSSEYQDKYTIQLLDMINRKWSIKYDPPSRVGIIGDSGVGKW